MHFIVKRGSNHMHSPETFEFTIITYPSEIFHFIPFHHSAVFHTDDFVSLKNILLSADILAADAVIFIFVLIIEHIDIKISHKAHRAAVI